MMELWASFAATAAPSDWPAWTASARNVLNLSCAAAGGGGGCASAMEVLEWPTTAAERDGCAFFSEHWEYYAGCMPDNPPGLACSRD